MNYPTTNKTIFFRTSLLLFIGFGLSLMTFLMTSCSRPQAPVFKKIKNVRVEDANLKNVTLLADAVLFNPNSVGCMIQSTDIDVIANEVAVGKIVQEVETEMPAQSEFEIPLVLNFPTKKIFEKNSGLLDGILSALGDKTVDVQYNGTIKVKAMGMSFNVPVEQSQVVPLKK